MSRYLQDELAGFLILGYYSVVAGWTLEYILEAQKGYSTLDASFIISISSVCGIVGTMLSGVVSDRLFKGRRNVPALIFGLTNTLALCLFLLVPGVHFWLVMLWQWYFSVLAAHSLSGTGYHIRLSEFLLFSVALNILFDLYLGAGVAGAVIATVFSQGVSAVLFLMPAFIFVYRRLLRMRRG